MGITENAIAVAAIVHEGKGYADAPLLEFVQRLKTQGLVVRGLVPGPQNGLNECAIRTVLDLETETAYPISHNLGKDSKGCSLDPDALLVAGAVLRRVIESTADLVIVNRFGILEAEGSGFSAEMLELMSAGHTMLTVVSPSHLEAWREFTGGMATELPPDFDAMMSWFNGTRQSGAFRAL